MPRQPPLTSRQATPQEPAPEALLTDFLGGASIEEVCQQHYPQAPTLADWAAQREGIEDLVRTHCWALQARLSSRGRKRQYASTQERDRAKNARRKARKVAQRP